MLYCICFLLLDAGRKNAVPTGDASQNLSEESKQLSGKRGRRRRARTRKRERKLSAGGKSAYSVKVIVQFLLELNLIAYFV